MGEPMHNTQPDSIPIAAIEQTSIASLKASLQGELLQPGDGGYDHARKVWKA